MKVLQTGRDGSLGHETSKVGIENPDILHRRHDSDVSIRSDDDNCTGITVNPVRRISLSTSVESDANIVNENPKPSHRQPCFQPLGEFEKDRLGPMRSQQRRDIQVIHHLLLRRADG